MLNKIKAFQKQAKELNRDLNSVEEFKMWLQAEQPEQSKPIIQPNNIQEVTWYAIVKSFQRYDPPSVKRLSMNFPASEKFQVILAVLAQAGFFGKKEGQKDYQEYKEILSNSGSQEEAENHLQFFYAVVDETIQQTESSAAISSEEWYGGFGTSKEVAQQMYVIADDQGGEEDWDE